MASCLSPDRLSTRLFLASLVLMTIVFAGCGGGSAGGGTGGTPTPTPTPTPSPTPVPGTAGLLLTVGSATVPTGGIFQYQLLLTEPKPIGESSTRPTLSTGPRGPVRGVAVNDASGKAIGIAVINDNTGDITVRIQSPDSSLGTDVDYPLLVLTMPVTSTNKGASFPMGMDPSSAFFNGGTAYNIQENVPGTLTIGGTVSITDVIPGGGTIKPGDTVKILGIGFDANTKIQMNNANINQTFVSSTEIDVSITSLCAPEINPCSPVPSMQLDGDRIRATNTSTNDVSEYFSYAHTDDVPGSSNNQLVTLVHPMFSQQSFTVGSFGYSASATQFTGIALQNIETSDATVKIELLDGSGNSVATAPLVLLPARTKMVRAISDFFSSVPAGTTQVRATVTTGPAIKMLGMLGDSSAGTVAPVAVTGQ